MYPEACVFKFMSFERQNEREGELERELASSVSLPT